MKEMLFNLAGIFLLISSASAVSEQTFYVSNSTSNTIFTILLKNVHCPTYKSKLYTIPTGTSKQKIWTAKPASVCSLDEWYFYITPLPKGDEWGYYKDLGKCSNIYIDFTEAYQNLSISVGCSST